ncbi:mrr restriction system protein [Rhodococcus opacus M213]|uniref:Mrr restriction system protein n=1 Tax=Rhodococcus opacus M213 TaxID=1129896 RepID=K8XRQ4_RHOOP|nr:restriction endonuclease [Rhodococcus opacus]EKT79740.1 mrr restriction system protein [Rhodococcus opacus M213]
MDATDLPRYSDFILPSVRAVNELGGSAKAKEIREHVLEGVDNAEELLAVTRQNRPDASVLIERIDWGRSYAKLIGALETPSRGLYLLTSLGKELLSLPAQDAEQQALKLDREFRRNRPARNRPRAGKSPFEDDVSVVVGEDVEEEIADADWADVLLGRLHRLTPTGFEEFVLFLLRRYGLELRRVGGSGDEGIDGIGTAPLSPVLSSRVAVQVKRYDPDGRPIGRDVVALFQRDAQAKGAERAILVTLGRFTDAARKAATTFTPTVDLIDGTRIAELVLQQEIGVRMAPKVDENWFDRFD